jgi:predicted transcriptional regulator
MTGKPSGPLTEAEHARIRELHEDGKSATEIAKAIGRAKSSVSRYAKKVGLSFDTEQTAVATVANQDRAAAIRAQMELQFAILASHHAKRTVAETTYVVVDAREGHEHRYTLPEPTAGDTAKLMQAAKAAFEASLKHAMVNAKDNDVSDVKAWADAMLGGAQ